MLFLFVLKKLFIMLKSSNPSLKNIKEGSGVSIDKILCLSFPKLLISLLFFFLYYIVQIIFDYQYFDYSKI